MPNGKSATFSPMLQVFPSDRVELTLGVQAFAGPRRSEYGQSETLVYLLAEFFF